MQFPRPGWAYAVLDMFTKGTVIPLNQVRESIGVYHGCQLFEGLCHKCEAEAGGCYTFIKDKVIDEEVDEICDNFTHICNNKETAAILRHCSQDGDFPKYEAILTELESE